MVSIVLSGCSTTGVSTEDVEALKTEIENLKTDVSYLKAIDNLKRMSEKTILQSDSTGYSLMETQSGQFTIAIENIEEYLDGYKIHLTIGNLMDAKFSNPKMDVNWGRTEEDLSDLMKTMEEGRTEEDLSDLMKTMEEGRTKTFDISEDLLAGSWNKVSVTIPSVSAEDIKYLSFKMYTDSISLRTN